MYAVCRNNIEYKLFYRLVLEAITSLLLLLNCITHRTSFCWKIIQNPICGFSRNHEIISTYSVDKCLNLVREALGFTVFLIHMMWDTRCLKINAHKLWASLMVMWLLPFDVCTIFMDCACKKVSLTCLVFPHLKWVHINHFSAKSIEWRSQQALTVPYCCSIEQTRKLYPPYWIGAKLFKRAFV